MRKERLKRLMSLSLKKAKRKTSAVTKLIRAFTQQTALYLRAGTMKSQNASETYLRALSRALTTTNKTCSAD